MSRDFNKGGQDRVKRTVPIFRKPEWAPDRPAEDARVAKLNWHKPLIAKLQAARVFKEGEKEAAEKKKLEIPSPPPLPLTPGEACCTPFWMKDPTARIHVAFRAFREEGVCSLEVVCNLAFVLQPPPSAMVCSITLHSSLMEAQTRILSNSAGGEVVELGTLTYNETCVFEIPDLPQDPMELLSSAKPVLREVELFEQVKSKKLQLSIRLYERPDKSTLCKKIIAQRRLPLVSVLGLNNLETRRDQWLELFSPAVGRQRLREVLSDAVSDFEAFERRAAGRIRVAKRGGGPTLDCAEFQRMMNDYGIVFERERRLADHSHSPYWHHHTHHSLYIGPYPHSFQTSEQAASVFRAVIRATDHPGVEEMTWPEFVKAVRLTARRLGVRIRQHGSPSAAAERRLALLQPLAVQAMEEVDNNRTVTLQSEVLSSLLALEPDHLAMLQGDFERKGGELEIDDFVELFRQRFGGKANVEDLHKLFVQIDANAGGSVAWSEFASSVLQSALSIGRLEIPHQVDKSDPILEGVSTTTVAEGLHFTSGRSTGLVAAAFVDSREMLLCVSSFGVIRAFHARSGAAANVYDMHEDPASPAQPLARRRGVNDVPPYRVLTAASFRGAGATWVAVSSTDRVVRFYDPMVHRVVGKHKVVGDAMVTSLYAFQLPIWQAAECHEWLVFGDAAGCVHLFNAQMVAKEIETRPEQNLEAVVTTRALIHRFRLFEPPIVRATMDMINIDRTEITAIRFVADLGCLAIASFGGKIAIFDLTNKEVRSVFSIHKMAVNVMEYVTPYKYLASAGQERDIVVFDPYTGRRISVMHGHHAAVVALAFQLSTERLISMDALSTLKWWNANTNEPIRTVSCIEDGTMTKYHHVGAFLLYRAKGTDKDYLALFAKDLRVWRLREGRARISTKFVYQDHIASIVSVQFSHPLEQIVSVDTTGLTAVWNMRTGQQVGWFQAECGERSVPFSALQGGDDGREKAAQKGKDVGKEKGEGKEKVSGQRERDKRMEGRGRDSKKEGGGLRLQYTSKRRRAREREQKLNQSKSVDGHDVASTLSLREEVDVKANTTVTAAVLDNSQRRLCVGWDQGALQMYNFSSGTLLNELISDAYTEITDITFVTVDGDRSEWSAEAEHISRDMYIVAAEDNGKLWVWPSKPRGDEKDIHTIRRLHDTAYQPEDIQCIAASTPHVLATGAHAGGIHVWNIASGRVRQQIEKPELQMTRTGHYTIDCIRFLRHPHEHVLVSTGSDGVLNFHNSSNGAELATFDAGPAEYYKHTDVTCMEIDSTNTFLFLGDSKGFLKTFEISNVVAKAASPATTTKEADAFTVERWEAFMEGVSSLMCVTPSGDAKGIHAILLLAGSAIGKVGVWSADGKPLGILRPGEKPCWSVTDVFQTCERSAELFKPAMQHRIHQQLGRKTEPELVLCLSIIQGNELNLGPESMSLVRIIVDGKEVGVTSPDVGSSPHWEFVERFPLDAHAHVLTLKFCELTSDDGFSRLASSTLTRYSEMKAAVGLLEIPVNTLTLHSERDDWFDLESKTSKEKTLKRFVAGQLGRVHLKVKLTTAEELAQEEEREYMKRLDQASLTVARWWMHSKSRARHAVKHRKFQEKAEETLFLKNPDGTPCQYGSRQVLERVHLHGGKWWPPPDESSRLGYYYKTKERRILEASRRQASSPSSNRTSPPTSQPTSRQRSPIQSVVTAASATPKLPLHTLSIGPASASLDVRPVSARPASSTLLAPYPSARRPATARPTTSAQPPSSPTPRPVPGSPTRGFHDSLGTSGRTAHTTVPPRPPPHDSAKSRTPRATRATYDVLANGKAAPSFTHPRASVVDRSSRGLEIASVAAASTVKAHPKRTMSPSKGTYDDYVPTPDPPPGSVLALNREQKQKEENPEQRELPPDQVRREMRKEWIFNKIIPHPDRAKRLSGMKTYQTNPDPAEVKPLVPIKKLKDQIYKPAQDDGAGDEGSASKFESAKKLDAAPKTSAIGRSLSGSRGKARPATARGEFDSQSRLVAAPAPPPRPRPDSASKVTPRSRPAVPREVGEVVEKMSAERSLRTNVGHLVTRTYQQAAGRKLPLDESGEVPAARALDSSARSDLLAKGSRGVYVSNPEIVRADPVPVVKLLTAVLRKAADKAQAKADGDSSGRRSRPASGTRGGEGSRITEWHASMLDGRGPATDAVSGQARGSKLTAGAATLGNALNAMQAGVPRTMTKSLAPPPSLVASVQSIPRRRSFIFKSANWTSNVNADKEPDVVSRPHSRLDAALPSPVSRKTTPPAVDGGAV